MRFALHGEVILPGSVAARYVLCDQGRIEAITKTKPRGAEIIEAEGYIAPGFIDIHVHGGAGADYMDGTPAAVRQANRAHLAHGTTTIFPTTTTGTREQIRRMLRACRSVQGRWTWRDGARIAGVHFYGPYFAEHKVGCHRQEGRRDPDPREYGAALRSGLVKIATCAAELPGAERFYRQARAAGCLVTCGHSEATWQDMAAAHEHGMTHVDHFWCAMSSVASLRQRHGTPMRASMEQFVLAHPKMTTEVIADGEHLSPELLGFAYQMIGPERLCLVTDANRALGMPPGRYRFGPQEDGSWFESNGRVGFVPGEGLASSVVGLDHMVRTMRQAVPGASLPEVVRMASLTPARLTGISHDTGSIEVGKRADLLVLDGGLHVKRVFVGSDKLKA